ncbi:MAG: tRNA 2-thiouridine(34) synthase MnmA [Rhodospirillales bacterium]|nr:tRNA 2-thiouridine(34) synthase MnmA [Rhodospirillales bacterium]
MSAALEISQQVDLGLAPGARVVVAMSGGVDSSVAAALVAAAGYETVGITLQLYDHGAAVSRPGSCCAGQDIRDARRVADRLGIAHYVLDYEQRFRKQVIEDFAASYAAGETPIPCVRCNERIKFHDLLGTARELGAAALVTGHYVRRLLGPDGPELHRAADPSRDQSYFLFATTREQLDYLRFPLGGLPKSETRAIAERLGLPVAAKPDSQDICFVPQGRYAAVVEKLRPGAAEPGDIVHVDGRVLGRHRGIIHYTVGQRRGLGIGVDGAPLYVVGLDAANRRVMVGPQSALGNNRVRLRGVNWLGASPVPEEGARIQAKLRSAAEPADATMRSMAEGGLVDFDVPQMAVAPGQAAVFYQGSRVLGGGWIAASENRAAAA